MKCILFSDDFLENMIDQTFLHLSGVGPVTEERIRQRGIRDWSIALANPELLPFGPKRIGRLLRELKKCSKALENDELGWLIEQIPPREQWRILGHYFDRASYFDIETSGLSYVDYITVIVCLHQGRLYRFVQGENLDDFLELLDEITLLVSFNGNSFDIPQLLKAWHIPKLPCPHLDLRWLCYHCGWRGGLKQVEKTLGITRPIDLAGVDGAEAVWLWRRWHYDQDHAAREKLVRYCAGDVLVLLAVAAVLQVKNGVEDFSHDSEVHWEMLEQVKCPSFV